MVSVVVISHNSEKFLAQTLKSVCDQTYDDIEILVVDDGSVDKSIEIINEAMQQDSRIILINDRIKLSRSEARNYGVSKAKGELIAFCDSDDIWEKEKLQKQVKLLDENPQIKMSFTGCSFIDSKSNTIGKNFSVPEIVNFKSLLKQNCIPCASVLLDKEVYLESPMKGDSINGRDKYREDYISWLGILKNNYIVCGINEPLIKYRIVENSVSSKKVKAFFQTFRTIRVFKNPFSSFYFCLCQFFNSRKKYKGVKRNK